MNQNSNKSPQRRRISSTRRLLVTALLAVWLVGTLTACAGPRMKRLSDKRYERIPTDQPVDVYVGKLAEVTAELAIIESSPYPFVDDEVKLEQIEELRRKTRRLGGNAVQDVRILAKVIRGFVVDERTPFTSWKQGTYEVYFMRGTAVRVPEVEPAGFNELSPRGGWIVDSYPPPPRLQTMLDQIPLPELRGELLLVASC